MPVYIYIVYTTTVLDYLPVGETAQLQEIVYDGSRPLLGVYTVLACNVALVVGQ